MEQRKNKSSNLNRVQSLLTEFIQELNLMSSNGVLRTYHYSEISNLREHYLEQCSEDEQGALAEEIDLILNSKLNYFQKEKLLFLSDELEQSVKDKILSIVKSIKARSLNLIGLGLQNTVLNPLRWIKTMLEPAIANTVLTYAVILNPPTIDEATRQMPVFPEKNSVTVESVNIHQSSLQSGELTKIKPYSESQIPVADIIEKERSLDRINKVKNHSNSAISDDKSTTSHSIIPFNPLDSAMVNANNSHVYKLHNNSETMIPSSIRPVSEIQEVFYLNEYKLNRSIQSHLKTSKEKHGKLSVKIMITPTGVPKNIEVTSKSSDKTITDRITVQLYQFRFSSVDSKLGDQTVYHTIYF
jgi:hypothetical protein